MIHLVCHNSRRHHLKSDMRNSILKKKHLKDNCFAFHDEQFIGIFEEKIYDIFDSRTAKTEIKDIYFFLLFSMSNRRFISINYIKMSFIWDQSGIGNSNLLEKAISKKEVLRYKCHHDELAYFAWFDFQQILCEEYQIFSLKNSWKF